MWPSASSRCAPADRAVATAAALSRRHSLLSPRRNAASPSSYCFFASPAVASATPRSSQLTPLLTTVFVEDDQKSKPPIHASPPPCRQSPQPARRRFPSTSTCEKSSPMGIDASLAAGE